MHLYITTEWLRFRRHVETPHSSSHVYVYRTTSSANTRKVLYDEQPAPACGAAAASSGAHPKDVLRSEHQKMFFNEHPGYSILIYIWQFPV